MYGFITPSDATSYDIYKILCRSRLTTMAAMILLTFAFQFYCSFSVLLFYFVPAGLYCLYNNLQFVNLAAYDPTTYYLLLQFRVVVTGVVFQVSCLKPLRCLAYYVFIMLINSMLHIPLTFFPNLNSTSLHRAFRVHPSIALN